MSSGEEEVGIIGEDGQIDLNMATIEVPSLPPPVQSFDGSGPRLIITKIVNNNFKSYAGQQVLGPFHKSFTCIIGPNGSGKSNVIDSMLFVFGYRASKIRSKKISVLIHSSEEHPNVDSCSVEVHFQKIIDSNPGQDDFEVVADSGFVISRSAFHDNSSQYHINTKRATYKEVSNLLKDYGIDLDHNRFLILQGEVEQIALMKPKAPNEHEDGLLEYLEDIIGSSRYKNPIAMLCKRVEALNDYRQEKLNRVKVVEREKADLVDIRNEAIDYLKLCNQVVRKKNILFQKYIVECESQLLAAEKSKQAVDEKMSALHEELKGLKEELKEKLRTNKASVIQSEKLLKAYNEGKERFSALEREDAKSRNEIKFTKTNLKKLKSQREEEERKIEDLTRVPEEAKARLDDLETKIDKLQKVKIKEEENLQKANEIAERDTQVLKKDKSSKEAQLASFQGEINEKKSELKLAQAELENMLSVYETEKKRLEEATQKKGDVERRLHDRSEDISRIKQSMPKAEHSLKQVMRDLEQVSQKEQQMTDELRSMRVKLEEHKSSFQATRSRSKVVNALMDLKARGTIPGIVGRLGDLGAIDDRYDVAISTACGSLDNIVTDTIDTAQKCVQYLKQHGIGHATFIGLDKMERWRQKASEKIATPEDSHRLFDLIKFKDDQVVTAFYYALRDTLVARDLEQATRISYGARRFRVVTLQGQLIETSGAMTGGGNQVCRGRMGNQVKDTADPKEVEQLEKSFETKSSECQRLKMNRARLEEAGVRLNREVTASRQSLDQYSMEVDRLRADAAGFAKMMKGAEAKLQAVKPDKREVEKLERKIPQLKAAFDKVNEGSIKLKKDVDAIHQKIVDVIGERVGTVQSRLDLVNSDLDGFRKQMTKVKVSVKTAERNLKKAQEKVETLAKDLEESTAKLETLTEKMKELEKEADLVIGAFRSAQEEGKAMQKVVDEEKKKIEELEAMETEKKKTEVTIQHELDQVKSVLDENAKRIRHWKKEISKLKLYFIEEEVEEQAEESSQDAGISMREKATTLQKFEAEELEAMPVEQVHITSLEDQLKAMKPNMAAIEEYRRKEELYLMRVTELEKVTSLRDDQRKQRELFKKQRLDEFMSGFHAITCKLKEMYQMITLGGDAELELVDSLDPFAEGIVFSVRPPKKSWKNISNLSGGEKTLSSLALVFALHHFKPTPLYVMDEIDAALDFKNVSIVANYIQTRTKNAQFIIISLRSNMFEMADRLVGIYKTFNCTQSITINPHLFHLTTAIPLVNSENVASTSQ